MNQRIQQLEKQASDYYWSLDEGVRTADAFTQKFAELIVEECMEQVWYTREDGINGNISQVIKDRIKEHFGVED